MESIRLIIQKLSLQYQTGASIAQLQHTTEELRLALLQASPAQHAHVPVSKSVSVLMPAGFGSQADGGIFSEKVPVPEAQTYTLHAEESVPVLEEEVVVTQEIEQTIPEFVSEAKDIVVEKVEVKTTEIKPVEAPFYSAPRPPHVTSIQPEVEVSVADFVEEQAAPLTGQQQFFFEAAPVVVSEIQEEVVDNQFFVVPASVLQEQELTPINSQEEAEPEDEGPVYFELDIPQDWQPLQQEVKKPNSIIPEGFLTGSPVGVAATAMVSEKEEVVVARDKPRELHEILAARVVATPEKAIGEKPGYLADKIGGSKITDLKKGIAINDRFRFINSLFRGDEAQFERAVKTINNFSILQEAMYWIQRELVVKNGWNEEDELVQNFFHLVRRRFL